MFEVAIFADRESKAYQALIKLAERWMMDEPVSIAAAFFTGRDKMLEAMTSSLRVRVYSVINSRFKFTAWHKVWPNTEAVRRIQKIMGWPGSLYDVVSEIPDNELAIKMAWVTDEVAREKMAEGKSFSLGMHAAKAAKAYHELIRDGFIKLESAEVVTTRAIHMAREFGYNFFLLNNLEEYGVQFEELSEELLQQLAVLNVSSAGATLGYMRLPLAIPSFASSYVRSAWVQEFCSSIAEELGLVVRVLENYHLATDPFGRTVDPTALFFTGRSSKDVSYEEAMTWLQKIRANKGFSYEGIFRELAA